MTLRRSLRLVLLAAAIVVLVLALALSALHLNPERGMVQGTATTAAAQGLLSAPSTAAVVPGSHYRRAPHDRVPLATPGVGMGRVLLGQLIVAAHEQGPAYRRDEFGPAWSDTDRNGCDTRNDVLAAWLIDAKTNGCEVTGGKLVDPYTGLRLTQPGQADIDHVVSLGDAWRSGAARWTRERRTEFANDRRHLVPVSASVNRAKGDRPAEKWLPPDAVYHCDYALIIVATKHAYRLTVTAEERSALDSALMTC
jgi:hypothetical protein